MSTVTPSKFDVIIVGGGHNGLVAAFYLARAGKRVAVFERRSVVGGPAATVEFFPGYRGAMTNSPGSLEPKIVADLELEKFGLRWIKPDPAVLMPFPDGRFFAGWRDQKRVCEMIARDFSVRDAEAYPSVFAFFDSFARRLGVSVFEPPPTLQQLVSHLKTPQDEADFAKIFFGSIREFVEERFETDAIRTVVAALATGGAFAPSTPGTPAALLQRPLALHSSKAMGDHDPRSQPLRGSTGLPVGGMGSITEAMRQSIERLGVVVKTDASVNEIIVGADDEALGIVLGDGTEYHAPIVVSNLHPQTTLLHLIDRQRVPNDIRGRLEGLPKAAGAFKLVLAVDEPPLFAGAPPELATAYSSCQLRFAPSLSYLEQCHQDYIEGRSTECPRLAGFIPTFTDPTLAPDGKHLLSINAWFFPTTLAGKSWETEKEVMGQRILKILADYIPSLKHSVTAMRCYSPLDLERDFGLVGGNFSHLEMSPAHMFSLRPVAGLSQYRTPIRGLYLCGSGTWPGGSVTGIPGHNAAHQVLRDLAEPKVALAAASFTRRDMLKTIAVGAVAAVAGGSSTRRLWAQEVGAPISLAELRKAGVAKIGLANQPPYSGFNPDGSVTGIVPTVVQAVMAKLGVPKLEAVMVPYGQLIPGMQARRWDFIGASLTVTKERCGEVLYTDPIAFDGGIMAYVPVEVPNPPKSIAEVASRGMRAGVLSGSYLVKRLSNFGISTANLSQFPDNPSLIDGLLAKRIQVAVSTRSSILALQAQRKNVFDVVYPVPEDMPRGSSPAFRKIDTELHEAFQRELRALKHSGEFEKIAAKFGFDSPPELMSMTIAQACALAQ
jgi:phytoene dehydrogenase-like protein/ABC-type amino acid transport substrate-binding protein